MFKKLAICSLTAVMFGTGSVALAHTGVKDAGIEGKTLYTALTIGHGCASATNEVPLPVIAQSVVFPNHTDSVWTKLDGTGAAVGPIAYSDVMDTAIPGPALLQIVPGLVQDKNIFTSMSEVADAATLVGAHPAPNVRGFKMKNGNLQTNLTGLVPFKISAPKFSATSCVKSLKVRIAIANWCKTSATNKAQVGDEARRADFWLGKATSKFSNPNVVSIIDPAAPAGTTSNFWPTLTINRDLVANPLPASCNNVGFDVAVEPSNTDIDTNLPITGYPLGK